MAPSLEEQAQIDMEAPLKEKPNLVAPEPGTSQTAAAVFPPRGSRLLRMQQY
jgi:hypothetical protein